MSLDFIANELITNVIKPGKGRIVVGLDIDPETDYASSADNDGPPWPDGFDPGKCKELAMKIIGSLINKISGKFGFGRGADNRGARFMVLFS